MVGRRCRGESVRCLDGTDDDQPNSSLSKKLKSCMVDLLLVRERLIWAEEYSGMPFSPGARIAMSKARFEACSCSFDPRNSYPSFILLFSVLPWREPWSFGLGPEQPLNNCVTMRGFNDLFSFSSFVKWRLKHSLQSSWRVKHTANKPILLTIKDCGNWRVIISPPPPPPPSLLFYSRPYLSAWKCSAVVTTEIQQVVAGVWEVGVARRARCVW